jgi:ATP-dependent Zn protease
MQSQTAAWVNMLISWMPFIILIAFWVYFMKRGVVAKQAKYMERNTVLMEQQQQLLERIATALEERNRSPR